MTSRLQMWMRQGCGEKEEQSLRKRLSRMSEDRWDFEVRRYKDQLRCIQAWRFVGFWRFGEGYGKGRSKIHQSSRP
jgi:hypothetical protein